MVYNYRMTPKLVEDFFTKEEIEEIKTVIARQLSSKSMVNNEDQNFVDQNNIVQQDHTGRIVMQGLQHVMPKHIVTKMNRFALTLWDYEVAPELVGITYNNWNKKYGHPTLPPHYDKGSIGLLIDYQIDSTTNWDLWVDGERFSMPDNSVVAFVPTRQVHWRTHRPFEDGEEVSLLFFEYSGEGISQKIDTEQLKKANTIYNTYPWRPEGKRY